MRKSEEVFKNLAFTTWETINNAFKNKISYGEDAITSVNLLSLKNALLGDLLLQDTRSEESTKGCDFEFWIGSIKGGWFRYAIQAKKITASSGRYDSLKHEVNGVLQIDILEQYARANKAIPIYCFFNYTDDIVSAKSSCIKYRDIKELGCSITPLHTVRKALNERGARNFSWFHKREETLPWSCLVRCPHIANHWRSSVLGIDIDQMIHESLPEVLQPLLSENNAEKSMVKIFEDGTSDSLERNNMFSREVKYKPSWVGVIDLDNS